MRIRSSFLRATLVPNAALMDGRFTSTGDGKPCQGDRYTEDHFLSPAEMNRVPYQQFLQASRQDSGIGGSASSGTQIQRKWSKRNDKT